MSKSKRLQSKRLQKKGRRSSVWQMVTAQGSETGGVVKIPGPGLARTGFVLSVAANLERDVMPAAIARVRYKSHQLVLWLIAKRTSRRLHH